jgi:hypothetical protein
MAKQKWIETLAKIRNEQMIVIATVTGVTADDEFACAELAGFGAGYFDGWQVVVIHTTGAAVAGEDEVVDTYTTASGNLALDGSLSAVLVTGDKVALIASTIWDALDGATNAEVDLQLIRASAMYCIDYWSDPQEEVQLTAVAGDKSLPNVTVAGLTGAETVARAYLIFKFRIVENTNVAANKLNGAQDIQIRTDAPGAWADAINLVDDMFSIAASTREGGDVYIGDIDLGPGGANVVTGNDTYNVQWDEAVADLGNLQFNDVQVGLRIYFKT